MRYSINFNKAVNRLVPYYVGGRKVILYLQSLMKPLQTINNAFADWATETRIEASMTSQVFKLEWYLNRKFRKYFADQAQRISISNGTKRGIPIYNESADIDKEDNLLLQFESENGKQTVMRWENETGEDITISFIVNSPEINPSLITTEKYTAMLKYVIDKYRTAGKTYIIKIR